MDFRVDIAHLCLYNLSVIHKKKYFDSELELMTYINENWDRLHPGEVGGLGTARWLKIKVTHEQVRQLKFKVFFFFLVFWNNFGNDITTSPLIVLCSLPWEIEHMVEISYLLLRYSEVRIIVVKNRTVRKILCIRCLMYNFAFFFSFL